MKLRVKRRGHARRDANGRRRYLHVGDEFDGTERELKVFSDRLERAPKGSKKEREDGLPTGNVADVVEALPSLSNEDLDKLEKADSRKGVKDAIAALRKQREDDGEEE